MTGRPSLRASSTARVLFLVSTTQMADGTRVISRMPPRVFQLVLLARRMSIPFLV